MRGSPFTVTHSLSGRLRKAARNPPFGRARPLRGLGHYGNYSLMRIIAYLRSTPQASSFSVISLADITFLMPMMVTPFWAAASNMLVKFCGHITMS